MSERTSLVVATRTHPGLLREHNEDAVFIDAEAGVVVLADGMGGYSAGEVASGMAIGRVSRGLLEGLELAPALHKIDHATGLTYAASLMVEQVEAANQEILQTAQVRPECAGMGTTLVAAMFYDDRICVSHIGDSRCYRLRNGVLEQLTHDHSLLQEQIDFGLISPDQAKYSLHKNLLTRALGIESGIDVEVHEYRLEPDDVYLLCSDGLTDMVEPASLAQILQQDSFSLAARADRMIEMANEAGGRDNISVILVHVPSGFLSKRFGSGAWWRRWVAGTDPT